VNPTMPPKQGGRWQRGVGETKKLLVASAFASGERATDRTVTFSPDVEGGAVAQGPSASAPEQNSRRDRDSGGDGWLARFGVSLRVVLPLLLLLVAAAVLVAGFSSGVHSDPVREEEGVAVLFCVNECCWCVVESPFCFFAFLSPAPTFTRKLKALSLSSCHAAFPPARYSSTPP
jgi:hypothetical protein